MPEITLLLSWFYFFRWKLKILLYIRIYKFYKNIFRNKKLNIFFYILVFIPFLKIRLCCSVAVAGFAAVAGFIVFNGNITWKYNREIKIAATDFILFYFILFTWLLLNNEYNIIIKQFKEAFYV